MPRQARCWEPSAPAHITDRGHEGAPIYRSAEDRRFALASATRAFADTGTRLYAYALMRNHVHLFVSPEKCALGNAMLRFKTRVAYRVSKRRGERGPVFQGRFFTNVLVDTDDAAFTEVLAYVLLNPLRARIVKSLEELETWEWTALPELLGLSERRLVDRDYVLRVVDPAGGDPDVLRGLVTAVYERDPHGTALPPQCVPVSRRVATEARMRQGQTGLIGRCAAARLAEISPHARHERLVAAGWTPERVVAWCCSEFGVSHHLVRRGVRKRPESAVRARACAIGWANGWSAIDMARATGVSPQAALRARDRVIARLDGSGLELAIALPARPDSR